MTLVKDKKVAHILISFCICSLLITQQAAGQLHTPNRPANKDLHLAEELYLQQQYHAALAATERYLLQPAPAAQPKTHTELDKAGYLRAASMLKTGHTDAEQEATTFINATANPAYKQRTAYALAQHHFNNNRFAVAMEYYELAGVANLDNDEIIQAKFELAYCYFSSGRFNQAEPLLASVRELGGKYYDAGNYYYGLLAYSKSNYEDALTSFKRIDSKAEYSNIVPYYIAEIHYFTGRKEKALAEALRLINAREQSFYHNELNLLAAHIYFEQLEYAKALPYFEYYYDNTDRIRKEDLYEMAYCYYKTEDLENAIDNFQQLSETRDSIGQSSMYLLGDCYLRTGDKKSARNAFSICADMPYIPGQKEASLLLAAQLSYELGFNSDAIYYTNILLAEFPNSRHTDEAKTLLSDLLVRTRNYAEAYNTLEDVVNRGDNYDRVFQKVTYGYAIQQMQAGNIPFADSLLTMSLKKAADPTYRAAANFWKADASYKLGNYTETITYGNRYMNNRRDREWVEQLSPAANERNMNIMLGYASMELSRYQEAQNYFSKARFNADTTDSVFIAATILREADAVFMQKDYNNAIALYDKVIAAQVPESDYALYQKAIIFGLSGNNDKKADILTSIINSKPQSKYANDARYELGLTFIEEDKYSSAINTLLPLTKAYEVRNMAPRAWMKIGFAYQQSGSYSKAIDAYKTIVEEYPTSEERPAALDALKSLYIQSGEPESYARLLKKHDIANEEENVLDSAYYATAEAQYAAGNRVKAKQLLEDYLNKYPNGVFVIKANYYLAETNYQLKNYNQALSGYDFVLNSSWNDFSENSAKRAASITFDKNDMAAAKNYYAYLRNNAMNEDNLRTAYEGLMLAHQKTGNMETAARYADTLLSLPGLEKNISEHATLIKANALMDNDNTAEAMTLYKKLRDARDGGTAAEARYNVAYIYYLQEQLKDAEAAANNTIKLSGGHDYWVVKSYILLADILVKQKDYFNAKATLQSIVKNTTITELKNIASEKLKNVKELESRNSKLSD